MPGVFDYSTTANSNTIVGGVSIAEGMAPGNVNNAMRAQMADARKWQLDWSGITTAGTGNAYTIASNQGIATYADGQRFSFRADRANSGAVTLNVDSRGAKAVRRMDGSTAVALAAGDLVAGGVYDVVYVLADDIFVVVNSFGNLPGLTATVAELNHVDGVTSPIQAQIDGKQAADADLTAISALTGTGILARTGSGTYAERTITSTDGSITITNPGGVAGNIDLSALGTRRLLATKTASASATLDFTEFNNATYRRYEFELENVKPATDGASLSVRMSSDGGASYDAGASDYDYVGSGAFMGGSTSGSAASATSIILNGGSLPGNAAGEFGFSGSLNLYNAASSSNWSRVVATLSFDNQAGNVVSYVAAGRRLAAQDTDALRFLFSSGNIASGTIRMFGVI